MCVRIASGNGILGKPSPPDNGWSSLTNCGDMAAPDHLHHHRPAFYDDLLSDSGSVSRLASQPRGLNKKINGLGVIPDLRFEYSYIRSIQSYVKLRRSSTEIISTTLALRNAKEDEGFEKVELSEQRSEPPAGPTVSRELRRETIEVDWKNLLWATTRDQIISPFLQGALW